METATGFKKKSGWLLSSNMVHWRRKNETGWERNQSTRFRRLLRRTVLVNASRQGMTYLYSTERLGRPIPRLRIAHSPEARFYRRKCQPVARIIELRGWPSRLHRAPISGYSQQALLRVDQLFKF